MLAPQMRGRPLVTTRTEIQPPPTGLCYCGPGKQRLKGPLPTWSKRRSIQIYGAQTCQRGVLLCMMQGWPAPVAPGILPSVLMLTACRTDRAPGREKAAGASLLCYSAELRPGRGCCGCMCGLLPPLAGGTVKHLSPLVNPQRKEKQVQSFTDCTRSRCHKKKKSPRTSIQSEAFSEAILSNQ